MWGTADTDLVTGDVPAIRRSNAERSAAMQHRLLEATIACLVERGWAATSTTEVVRRAGVSRGAQVHHFPTKEDLVLAALQHLLDRRIAEFDAAFRDLPINERTPAHATRLLYHTCFGSAFEAWLELVLAARTDHQLHARFVQLEKRFFDAALTAFRALFPAAAADPSFARTALHLTLATLDGLALNRLIGVPAAELDEMLDAFTTMATAFLPPAPGDQS